jgi:hypothetical protein
MYVERGQERGYGHSVKRRRREVAKGMERNVEIRENFKAEEKAGNGTAKITVTAEAERMLDEMVRDVNNGFSGGRVTRQDVATWLVRYFHGNALAQCLEEIRSDHFDQLAHLETLLKQAKKARRSGADAVAIASILSGASTAPVRDVRKRSKKIESIEQQLST